MSTNNFRLRLELVNFRIIKIKPGFTTYAQFFSPSTCLFYWDIAQTRFRLADSDLLIGQNPEINFNINNSTSPYYFTYKLNNIWAASSEFGTYRLCEQRRFRPACASAQSRQNLRYSLIQAVSQAEPSDRKPDPWLL